MARRRMNGSATSFISMADILTRVSVPRFPRASCKANALIMVASMPISSALARSISRACCGDAAKKIAAADHDGNLHAKLLHVANLRRNLVNALRLHTKALVRGESLTGYLEQNTFISGGGGGCGSRHESILARSPWTFAGSSRKKGAPQGA